jgi:tRNA-2-methylthio-N6-dimethylallyladenosine synthase
VEIPKKIDFNFSLGDEIDVRIKEARPFSLTGELYL